MHKLRRSTTSPQGRRVHVRNNINTQLSSWKGVQNKKKKLAKLDQPTTMQLINSDGDRIVCVSHAYDTAISYLKVIHTSEKMYLFTGGN